MERMLPAGRTVLVELDTIRVVLLVLHCVVIATFALCACQRNLDSHYIGTSISFPLSGSASLQAAAA